MSEKTVGRALVDALMPYVSPDHDILDVAEAIVEALGIPASALASLRAGTHVVVEKARHEAAEAACVGYYGWEYGGLDHPDCQALIRWHKIAAAQPRQDEGNG